ncbi:MAG: hypothetical protein COU07_03020 [Candidatus Harrisonbacteria bacterium CG10_big_fil_rev_8_21_14_0_10_40_38]|uniref:DUF192 domain-containing protein n=1 Tax=Candidatus Harrisonbacteria bacterium CG10_big_fil_rev_8_21_14_0_10_40_38 TaxID=1974583 RepID=A0A2H0URK4_9BACT|nr:MAG: hypothetical protein COU07_03020 [Candidatus Harrisonbacteria bacterium CG10_big_fil_rev_8_21_14_0_10_40_38]
MKKIIIFLIFTALFGTYAFQKAEKTIGEDKVVINGAEFFVKLADSKDKYIKGLSGVPGLRDNEGMLFLFDKPDRYGFWMKDMLFSIDIIWISRGKIIGIEESLEPVKSGLPPLYYPKTPVDMVLEVKAGTAIKYQMKEGDSVKIYLKPKELQQDGK